MRISDWSSDVCSCDLLSRTVPTASRCPFARMGWCNAPKCAIAPAMTDPRDILNSVFGFSDFRGVQRQVIARVLDGTRTLAVMPTGAGKSLCYQLPAVMREGTCVVVSPLIALMHDQLRAAGIGRANGRERACRDG